MSSALFGRVARLLVGPDEIEGLRLAFTVRRNGDGFDGATLTVWGLNADAFGALGRTGVRSGLVAGYETRAGTIILGTTVPGSLSRSVLAGEQVTTWQVQEGGDVLAGRRLALSWGGQVRASEVLAQIARDLGLSWQAVELPRDPTYARGWTSYGAPRASLDVLAADCGCRWGVRAGRLTLIPISGAARTRTPVLSPTSGLVGYPEAADRGRVVAVSLLDPGLLPGDRYRVEGDAYPGDYIAETVEHRGDTFDVPWYTTLTGRRA